MVKRGEKVAIASANEREIRDANFVFVLPFVCVNNLRHRHCDVASNSQLGERLEQHKVPTRTVYFVSDSDYDCDCDSEFEFEFEFRVGQLKVHWPTLLGRMTKVSKQQLAGH